MLIVGEKEAAEGAVSVRRHGEGDKGAMPVDLFAAEIKMAVDTQMLGVKPAGMA
jgi:threonyl-tRNA synthetase